MPRPNDETGKKVSDEMSYETSGMGQMPYLLLAQELSVGCTARSADAVQRVLQALRVVLYKTELELKHLVCGSSTGLNETGRDGFAGLVKLHAASSKRRRRSEDERRECREQCKREHRRRSGEV